MEINGLVSVNGFSKGIKSVPKGDRRFGLSSFRTIVSFSGACLVFSQAGFVVPGQIWSARLDLESQARLGDPASMTCALGRARPWTGPMDPGPGPILDHTSCGR